MVHLPASLATVLLLAAPAAESIGPQDFSYRQVLLGPPPSLSVSVESINRQTGVVRVNGSDTRQPTIPFTFDWGDGQVTRGWFPAGHTYRDRRRSYVVRVAAQYAPPARAAAETVVRFMPPAVTPVDVPADVRVTIPSQPVRVVVRSDGLPLTNFTCFTEESFCVTPRSTVEYVLSVGAAIQKDFVNNDFVRVDGGFRQVILRDAAFGGMYCLWHTRPPGVAAGQYALGGEAEYSSFLHEMGHNVTLNTPGRFPYGGNTEGPGGGIYSEALAQIFQHATLHEMITSAPRFGISADLAADLKRSALATAAVLRDFHEKYLSGGRRFSAWDDPKTPDDEALGTFMTVACVFLQEAEKDGRGYRTPVQRMMRLLQQFNEDLARRFDARHDTPQASAFRATLMAAAVSYAFDRDLRPRFRDLGFPIDDAAYAALQSGAAGGK